jgi:hypothetical protein
MKKIMFLLITIMIALTINVFAQTQNLENVVQQVNLEINRTVFSNILMTKDNDVIQIIQINNTRESNDTEMTVVKILNSRGWVATNQNTLVDKFYLSGLSTTIYIIGNKISMISSYMVNDEIVSVETTLYSKDIKSAIGTNKQ